MPANAVDSLSRSTGGAAEARPALAMLNAFAGVGAERFHLLLTDLGGGKVSFRGNRSLAELDGIVQAHLAGTNDDLRHLSPLKILLDDARTWARSRGDHVLHLGGGRAGKKDSLFAFKARFSPSRHTFHTGRWIREPRLYREFVAVRRRSLGVCDSSAEEYFPGYRARPASAAGVRK